MRKLKKSVLAILAMLALGVSSLTLVSCGNASKYGEWEIRIEPTCTEKGQRIRYKINDPERFQIEEIPALGHLYLEDNDGWVIIVAPTETSEGTAERVCARCKDTEYRPVEMLPQQVHVDIMDGDNILSRVNVDADGNYTLANPQKIGYDFIGFVDEQGTTVANTGTIQDSIQIYTVWELAETKTFAELQARAAAGVDKILITNDIEITESVFVVGKTEIYAEQDVVLKRAANFAGDLFVIGETAQGENVLVLNGGARAELTLKTKNDAALTIDGNKQNVTVDVNGSSLLVLNSSIVNMYDGVNVVNAQKVANSKLLGDYKISHPNHVGGAAMVVANGTFNMYGGKFANNAVNLDETYTGDDDEAEDNLKAASCGGAIYNYSVVNIYGGSFEDNQASRGGAIYNYRTVNLMGGTFKNNQASLYAGAVYLPGSQYTGLYIGAKNAPTNLVTFEGNTAKKSGGAIFGQTKNAIVIKGGVTFQENESTEGNGGAINTSGALTINGATFNSNQAASKGGAIYVYYSNPELTVRQVEINSGVFYDNQASKGGALAFSASSEDFEKGTIGYIGAVTFSENHAFATATDDPELPGDETDNDNDTEKNYNGNGGAVYVSRNSDVTINGAEFTKNTAERNGGAVYVTGNSLVDIATATFTENSTDGKGGAMYVTGASNVTIDDCELTKNTASVYAGAVAIYNGAVVSIKDSELNENDATSTGNGGAIFCYKATLNTENVTANYNNAKSGGAIFMTTGSAINAVGELTMEGNTAGSGGAIDFYQEATGVIEKLTVTNNSSTGNGGALYVYTNCDVSIQNLIATGNKSTGVTGTSGKTGGGVIYVSGAAKLKLYNVTATNNSALKGGFIYMTTKKTEVHIFAGTANDNVATDGGSTIYSASSGTKLYIKGQESKEYFDYNGTIEGSLPAIEETQE